MRFGYITNGFRDHALEDALAILAGEGYQGVGITLDTGHLHPYRAGREDVLQAVEAGVDGYLLKPFQGETLKLHLEAVMPREEDDASQLAA